MPESEVARQASGHNSEKGNYPQAGNPLFAVMCRKLCHVTRFHNKTDEGYQPQSVEKELESGAISETVQFYPSNCSPFHQSRPIYI
ncbi:hypothetical protein ACFQ5I_06590 [Companilactobacillus mishanensis]